mmetsp:Transcript_12449/g.37435  ORF Transcript_12449/g.37435 Transcript_12449/m.37435 type:complete len:460 (+) Transcript_12449:201-1580(+)
MAQAMKLDGRSCFGAGAPLQSPRCRSAVRPAGRKVTTIRSVAAPPKSEEGTTTRLNKNPNLDKLQAGYLFPEIAKRRNAHIKSRPDAKIISLGIGDTTEPIPSFVASAMAKAAEALGTLEGYSGYGSEAGKQPLREAIAKTFYSDTGVNAGEVFVSDGSKCDLGRLQMMFGSDLSVAVQDPAYPVYVDSSVIMGMTGNYNPESVGFDGMEYMPCSPANSFFPDLAKVKRTDLIFFCSPNNPTGAAATRQQLEELVAHARKNGSIIVYDAAYALYISDRNCPKSIFEIPGAETCAMETCSFSKYAGFTGVRLGWTVVPDALRFADGSKVQDAFVRVTSTVFNGASNLSQAGGLACLEPEGLSQVADLVAFYKENATILRKCFQELGFEVYGGDNAPYVWVGFPGKPSWDVFAEILDKCDIVTTPGSGFGPTGEGFVRASAFAHREDVLEAVNRFKKAFGK